MHVDSVGQEFEHGTAGLAYPYDVWNLRWKHSRAVVL